MLYICICVVVSAYRFSSSFEYFTRYHGWPIVQCYRPTVKCVIRTLKLWSSGKLIVIIMAPLPTVD